MRRVVNYMLMYALSPLGTIMNTGMLVVVLLLWGADPKQAMFWLIVAIFVLSSGLLDLRGYLGRRRKGLTSYQAAEAVTDAIWGPPRQAKAEEEEAA